MTIKYIDPPVSKAEISTWKNYRYIRFEVKDKNNKTLITGWKREDNVHIAVWRLDYAHTYRKLNPNHPPEKEVRSGICHEAFNTIDEILAVIKEWETDTALLDRMRQWYGPDSPHMPVF